MSTCMETSQTGNQGDDIQRRRSELITLEQFVGRASYRLCPLKMLFHVTGLTSHYAILEEKNLRGRRTRKPSWSMLAQANADVSGVWFCSTLYEGGLPDISPYGSHRFILTASDLLDADTLFFYDTTYHFVSSPENQYVRFVAVKRHQKGFDWCHKNLPQTNTFFCQGRDGIISALQNNEETVKFWLEVLVVGDVSLEDNRWNKDRVKVKGRRSTPWSSCVRGISLILDEQLKDLALSRCTNTDGLERKHTKQNTTCINKQAKFDTLLSRTGMQENDIQCLFWELITLEKFLGLARYRLWPLKMLFHATSEKSHSAILNKKILCGGATTQPSWSMLAMDKVNTDVNGVWFCSTLYKGDLPTISPYGSHRFILTASDLLDADTLFFYDTTYYFVRSPENQYVRFVAVKHNQKGFDWCYRNLPQIHPSMSLLFCQEKDGTFSVLQNNEETVKFWLEVLVVGDVSLEDNRWKEDKVTENKFTNCTSCVRGISPILGERLKDLVRSRSTWLDLSELIKKMNDLHLR